MNEDDFLKQFVLRLSEEMMELKERLEKLEPKECDHLWMTQRAGHYLYDNAVEIVCKQCGKVKDD